MIPMDDSKQKEPTKAGAFPFSPSGSGTHRLPTEKPAEKEESPGEEAPEPEQSSGIIHGSYTPPSGEFRQLHISEIHGKIKDPSTDERSNPEERDPNTDPLAPFHLGQRDTSQNIRRSSESIEAPPLPQDVIPVLAIAAACGIAALTALVWGAVALAIGMQASPLAILVGVSVGSASMALGGRGRIMGSICFTLALAGIMAGKLFVANLTWPNVALTDLANQRLAPHLRGAEPRALAQEYMLVANDDELRRFIARHGFVGVRSPDRVTTDHIAVFLERFHPHLMAVHGSAERGRHGELAEITGMNAWEAFKRSFGVIDMIFILVGLMLAFLIGGGRDGE